MSTNAFIAVAPLMGHVRRVLLRFTSTDQEAKSACGADPHHLALAPRVPVESMKRTDNPLTDGAGKFMNDLRPMILRDYELASPSGLETETILHIQ